MLGQLATAPPPVTSPLVGSGAGGAEYAYDALDAQVRALGAVE